MPTNLYGPNDNYNLENSHVLPALIRKFHLAMLASKGDWKSIEKDEVSHGPIPDDILARLVSISKSCGHGSLVPSAYSLVHTEAPPKVVLWGTGSARREFLYSEDLADACLFLMNRTEDIFSELVLPQSEHASGNSVLHACPVEFSSNRDYSTGAPRSMLLINIGCGKDQTVRELAELVAKIVGYEGDIEWDISKPDGTPQKLLDVSKITSLGRNPRISLKDGLRTTYEWYLQKLARMTDN